MQRETLAKEMLEEQKLRTYVRKAIKVIKERKNKQFIQEKTLREHIKSLISEINTDVSTESPHKSTGINTLANLLKNVIPTIENEYKQLTSDHSQRDSFRAHLLKAVQNSLAPIDAVANAPEEPAQLPEPLAEKLAIDIEDDAAKFIPARQTDIDQEKEEKEAAEEAEDTFGIPGQDETGRNFAEKAFNSVETQILDAYKTLSNEEDKEVFYDYLLTNLKLYFDKFEDELATNLTEPTTSEYEEIKGQEV